MSITHALSGTRLACFALLACTLLQGCTIAMLQPVFTSDESAVDIRLLGKWVDVEKGRTFTFKRDEELANRYLVIGTDSSGDSVEYYVTAGHVARRELLDVVVNKWSGPNMPDDEPSSPILKDAWNFLTVTHRVFIADSLTDSTVVFRAFDLDSARAALRKTNVRLYDDGEPLLTGTPAENRAAIKRLLERNTWTYAKLRLRRLDRAEKPNPDDHAKPSAPSSVNMWLSAGGGPVAANRGREAWVVGQLSAWISGPHHVLLGLRKTSGDVWKGGDEEDYALLAGLYGRSRWSYRAAAIGIAASTCSYCRKRQYYPPVSGIVAAHDRDIGLGYHAEAVAIAGRHSGIGVAVSGIVTPAGSYLAPMLMFRMGGMPR